MKKILLFTSLVSCTSISAQDNREAIKIEVDKDCKSSINKITFKDEIYTKPVRIVNTLNTVVTLMFSYKENFIYDDKGSVLNIWFNEDFLTRYLTDHIYLTIDGKEFDLHQLIEFETYDQTIDNKTETWWGLGFYLDSDLKNAFDSALNMEMGMLERKSHERNIWKFNPLIIKSIVDAYDCFVTYYSPIDLRLSDERKIARENYEKNLKEYDVNYRDSKWFDNKETVKKSQSTEPSVDREDAIAYQVKLNNDDFLALYYFNQDRLYQGVYVLEEDYVNENNFYTKYKEIQKILTSKYGEPKNVTKHRSKDLFDGANEIGMAIQTGGYSEYTLWETKKSTITLIIEGENFDSKLTIRYNTKDTALLMEVKKDDNVRRTDGF